MKCPNCNTNLAIADRSGVEIDYCPDCRGIWLDRGELDKIIERSATANRNDVGQRHRITGQDDPGYNDRKKKKDSFLGDLFDF